MQYFHGYMHNFHELELRVDGSATFNSQPVNSSKNTILIKPHSILLRNVTKQNSKHTLKFNHVHCNLQVVCMQVVYPRCEQLEAVACKINTFPLQEIILMTITNAHFLLEEAQRLISNQSISNEIEFLCKKVCSLSVFQLITLWTYSSFT